MAVVALFIILAVIGLLLMSVGRSKKPTPPKRTEQQRQADELITTILPTINNDK